VGQRHRDTCHRTIREAAATLLLPFQTTGVGGAILRLDAVAGNRNAPLGKSSLRVLASILRG